MPARGPDLNQIVNLFHLVKSQLSNDAIVQNIKKENFQEFSARVQSTILNFDNIVIDKIIESMSNRIELVVNRKREDNSILTLYNKSYYYINISVI
jgi:hypothetical protein